MAKKSLFLIHGRSFKPNAEDLGALWIEALQHGLTREFGRDAADALGAIDRKFIYFGDLSNRLLARRDPDYDEGADLKARREALDGLKTHAKEDFNKRESPEPKEYPTC